MEKRRIYLDHAATTAVSPEVFEKMKPYFCEIYGNASSLHSFGVEAANAVDKARAQVAHAIGAQPSEIYFTSGGSESDNWAVRGMAKRKKRGRIITSAIEHPAMINTLNELKSDGFDVVFLPVSSEGIVDARDVMAALTDDTILVSIMSANNEVGALQPIEEIAKICNAKKIPFHTDAVQAIGALRFDVKKMGIDLLSMSGHKFYGPKGIGVLYIRNGLGIGKFLTGGEQERTMRAGTTMTPQIVGIGEAIERAYAALDQSNERLIAMRDRLIDRILSEIPYTRLNGPRDKRLPNNVNISYEFIEGESILMLLDMAGIAVSTGSACSSGSLKSSYVLAAMGVREDLAHGSIRMTLGSDNTMADVDYTVDRLKEIVKRLREMSPLFLEVKGETKDV